MVSTAMFAEIATLAGDPARAAMLNALMDGRALTATELASVAGITPQTASGHLNRMTTAGLLAVEKQGRHRYHRLAAPTIAQMVESIMQVASTLQPQRKRVATGPRDAALRTARTCYDHLAGQLGVALADALVDAGHAELDGDVGAITESGVKLFSSLGIDLDRPTDRGGRRSARVLCRPCLDWSERRPHLAGRIGAALCTHAFEHNWIRRVDGTRAVSITPRGQQALRSSFGITLP
ncbi:helix-turn-helix transcriptional regulator [Thalassobaculum sp.]|uniref:ArsR/SmtB family transcription factor n=1 Tax=Thalassobaculum sp. TaxID=2022740 RepID=UPI0032EDE809